MKRLLLIYTLLLPLLSFSQNVKNYNKWVYDGDKNITEYEIPDGVKTIAYRAFDNCPNLTKISLPATVSEIQDEILRNCPLMTVIEVHPDNNNYTSINGVLFNRDTTTIVCCPNAMATDDYIIPEKVTTIGRCAFFGCKNLTKLIIPTHIKEICGSAFEECINITSVYIPASVRGIEGCAFSTCYSLKSFEVDKGNKFFSTIDGVLFNNDKTELISCPNKAEYTIPASTRIIGQYAFQGDKDLKSLTIPNSVVIIEEGALSFCNGLSSITIPKSVRKMERATFWHSENLSSITIEYGVEKIEDRAFMQCTGLTSIIIPGSVKVLERCFQGCINLTNVTLKDGVEIIENESFLGTKIKSITIPGSVKEIGKYAFQKCENLSSVIIENGVGEIDVYAFSICNSLDSIVIPGSVKTIGENAFWKCENLKYVTLQNGVETIKEHVFSLCNNLREISIPGSVKTIGTNTIDNCSNLSSVTLSNGTEKISSFAFNNCINLKQITIPESVIKIEDDAFKNCNNLTLIKHNNNMDLAYLKLMVDIYISREQIDSVQYYAESIINKLKNNQNNSITYQPEYYSAVSDVVKFFSSIGDYQKMFNYSKEGYDLMIKQMTKIIESEQNNKFVINDYIFNSSYLLLQMADANTNLKNFETAKTYLRHFEFYQHLKYFDLTNDWKDNYNLIGKSDATILYHIKEDYRLGLYYYYLMLKLIYYQQSNNNIVNCFSQINAKADFWNYIYYWKVVEYILNLRCIVNKDLSESSFESSKKKLIDNVLSLGLYHAEFNTILSTIGNCYNKFNNYDSAFAYYSKSFNYELDRLKDNFSFMNTYQRQNYWEEHRISFENIVNITTKLPDNDTAIAMAYNSLLVSKGLILASEQNLTSIILDSKDDDLKNNFFALKTYRTQLDTIKNERSRDSIRTLAEHLETDLMQRSSQFADIVGYMNVDWRMVKKSLGKKDVAIEFFYNRDSLYALVLKKDFETPKLVPLSGFNKDFSFYSTTELYEAIWKPLEEYMSENGNTYFSPSGALYNIAIEYAPIDSTHIISDKYKIYRISSTRNLALSKNKPNPNKKAATYGGIQYNFGPGNWADRKDKEYDSYVSDLVAFRDVPDLENTTLRTGVQNLIGTKIEAQQITDILRNNGYQVSENNDIYATEESFKNLSGSGLNLLHIATHGFYQPKDTVVNNSYEKEDISLSQSGLLFAGANSAIDPQKRKEIPEGFDDGILTAKEISRMDLKGLDLVVLSACQTGLGEVTSEGVFGLQRGFKKAGANTIVMSLWKVDDNATKDLMTEFYKNLVSGKSKRDAFLGAQAMLRSKYKDPKKWAAFVMVDGVE